jgi:epsilon-lactone hydrolase
VRRGFTCVGRCSSKFVAAQKPLIFCRLPLTIVRAVTRPNGAFARDVVVRETEAGGGLQGMKRSFPPPAGISEAARHFLQDAAPIADLNLSLEALIARRQEIYASVAPGGKAVQEGLNVAVEWTELDGVPVQWVMPQAVRGDAIILYFFGGGHITGSPDEDLAITARLAHFSGCRICVPAYRLAPEHPYPAALEDAVRVYRALLKNHPGQRIGVAGESAGGNLVLGLVSAAAAAGLTLPDVAALMSPWCDLGHSGDTIRTLDGIDPTLDLDHQLEHMARAYAGGRDRTSPEISPLFAPVPAGFPPTVITSGTRDVLLSDAARLSTKLREAGVTVDLRLSEGMWHVFEYYPDLPEAEASLRGIAAFMTPYLAEKPA